MNPLKTLSRAASSGARALVTTFGGTLKSGVSSVPSTLEEVSAMRESLGLVLSGNSSEADREIASERLAQLKVIEARIEVEAEHARILAALDADEEAAIAPRAVLEESLRKALAEFKTARDEVAKQKSRVAPLKAQLVSADAAVSKRIEDAEAGLTKAVEANDDERERVAAQELHDALAARNSAAGGTKLRITKIEDEIRKAEERASDAASLLEQLRTGLAKIAVAVHHVRVNRATVELTFARAAWHQARAEAGLAYDGYPFEGLAWSEDYSVAGVPGFPGRQRFAHVPFMQQSERPRISVLDFTPFEMHLDDPKPSVAASKTQSTRGVVAIGGEG